MKNDPDASETPTTPSVSGVVVLDFLTDLGFARLRPECADRLRRLVDCCGAVHETTPVRTEWNRVVWSADERDGSQFVVDMTARTGIDGWMEVQVRCGARGRFEHAVDVATLIEHDAFSLVDHVTPRTLPVLTALCRSAIDILEGACVPLNGVEWQQASHTMCAPILASSPDGPATAGHGDDPTVVHDHVAETPFSAASLRWHRGVEACSVEAPDAPAMMTMTMGDDAILHLGWRWVPSDSQDTPSAMDALRSMARLDETRHTGERR